MTEFEIRTEAIRFLRARGKSDCTNNVSSQRAGAATVNMYCTQEYPVMLFAVPGTKRSNELRPNKFELTLLHGVSIEKLSQSLAEAVAKLLGVKLTFNSHISQEGLLELSAGGKTIKARPQHILELDGLVPDQSFYSLVKIYGIGNKRIAAYTNEQGERKTEALC